MCLQKELPEYTLEFILVYSSIYHSTYLPHAGGQDARLAVASSTFLRPFLIVGRPFLVDMVQLLPLSLGSSGFGFGVWLVVRFLLHLRSAV